MASWEEVERVLEDKRYKWRTVRGMAEQLNTSQAEIQKILAEHLNEIIKSAIPANTGEDLFTTRNHYKKVATVLDRITSSITQSVSTSVSSSSSSISSSSSSSPVSDWRKKG